MLSCSTCGLQGNTQQPRCRCCFAEQPAFTRTASSSSLPAKKRDGATLSSLLSVRVTLTVLLPRTDSAAGSDVPSFPAEADPTSDGASESTQASTERQTSGAGVNWALHSRSLAPDGVDCGGAGATADGTTTEAGADAVRVRNLQAQKNLTPTPPRSDCSRPPSPPRQAADSDCLFSFSLSGRRTLSRPPRLGACGWVWWAATCTAIAPAASPPATTATGRASHPVSWWWWTLPA
jgi:hypothetical protein